LALRKTRRPAEQVNSKTRILNLDLHNLYDKLFIILFIVDIALRLLWLDKPDGSLIFDEWYYVNVARVILGLKQSIGSSGTPPYQNVPIGLDPNHEHPPLAKLFIALSIHLLGDNGWGWRIPSVIMGSIAVLAFYLLLKKISPYESIPIVGTFLFSFDNLVFVLSRIAILDIFTLSFMIVAFYWYFSGHSYWSAIAMALSTLCKITGAAGFLILAVVHAGRVIKDKRNGKQWNAYFSWFEKYLGILLVSFFVILTIMDRVWVGYSTPFEHLQYILSYSSALVSSCPNGIISCPWQWLINQIQIPFLIVNVKVSGSGVTKQYDSVAFWGAMNPSILYLTIPAMAYCAYSYLKQKKQDFTLLMLSWFAITYLPYYPAVLIGHRVTYLFYFLPAVPPVCAAIAYMIADQNPPKLVVLFYLAVVLVSFYLMFPFKTIP